MNVFNINLACNACNHASLLVVNGFYRVMSFVVSVSRCMFSVSFVLSAYQLNYNY